MCTQSSKTTTFDWSQEWASYTGLTVHIIHHRNANFICACILSHACSKSPEKALVHMIQFLYHNLRFRPPIVPSLLLIVLQSEAVVRWCSAKNFFANIASFTRKHQNKRLAFHEVANLQSLTLSKRDSGTDVFFGKFCEISHNIFLKNSSDGCFCINTRSVYFPTTNFRFSENDVTNKKRGNKSELNISNP